VALAPDPPAADALGRVGRPRMLGDIALDDLRDRHASLVAGPTHEAHPRRTISASDACAMPWRKTLESGDLSSLRRAGHEAIRPQPRNARKRRASGSLTDREGEAPATHWVILVPRRARTHRRRPRDAVNGPSCDRSAFAV